MIMKRTTLTAILLAMASTLMITLARAEEKSAPTEDASPDAAELEKIKQRYWAQGNEKEMGVVQNRLYTKEGRVEVTLLGGFVTSDPFLNVRTVGGSLGYHFDETFSLHAFSWKDFTSGSAALTTLQEGGKKANTNRPFATAGMEARASLLYGKLSLVGRKILYYDMHAGAGVAVTRTENGTYPGPVLSIGQNIFLTNSLTFRVDYRLTAYREDIIEREITAKLGQNVGMRNNFSNALTFGFSWLWGGSK
jgi:outer membrane beta-barrel protein